jgi:hypothetical protein
MHIKLREEKKRQIEKPADERIKNRKRQNISLICIRWLQHIRSLFPSYPEESIFIGFVPAYSNKK